MADISIYDAIKDFLWAPALGLVAWAWKHNEKEHEALQARATKMEDGMQTIGSHLNDKLMDHIDDQVRDVRMFVMAEDTKLMAEMSTQRGHIGKLFDKMEEQGKRNEDRHLEVLKEIRDLSNTMHTALSHKVDK